ncbi:uridine diphosphate-N-acetylglucosamine-binding protein YvcK [Candidatus Purcelliella pentastirinorum]|uniref:gluconeogenesis factor YvcK family protein n=1 Tax=Candidatus Purcelliella pentastirinorum TaxID=472834 RepID=UPI0023689424|nr:uridine diphosphate-N-acetylglucosamine-binding protein YvcK [Candidatus Purcelliella pentastirinorum]WDI78793.1 uridine diphosphate-N-acetylglucosamine-binding protein YvcK [Candidatus Purcelliella pentastirinorum]WDR79926.1 uridine diphosphate-N-acetylglucosamine-binding protein YvcK [Candidatus Purcelliella pentastirinorum]
MNMYLKSLNRVVALGGGHGLGRVMVSLSHLGSRLTGIVVTSDNGGSSGRIRQSEGGIAWGDLRNCLNQLINKSNVISNIFNYRFKGIGDLSGHNLGNLILKALDNLSIRPLEVINIIRNLFKIESFLIPMTEKAVDLVAIDRNDILIYGETAIDILKLPPKYLKLYPDVSSTIEGLKFINKADLILIGPGSFYTSLIPILLVKEIALSLSNTKAIVVFIDNLSNEISLAASSLTVFEKILIMEKYIGGKMIDALIVTPDTNIKGVENRLIIRDFLGDINMPYHHDIILLNKALDKIIKLKSY